MTARRCAEKELTKRAVVGSFLLRRDQQDGRPKVALFRRSDKVNTYQGKFATISGGIEPSDASPLDAARREILEETSLTTQDSVALRFLASGQPYSFVDRVANYEWSVHPFAFRLDAPEADIHLGWEHEAAFSWFEPHALPAPEELAAGIVESLRRVWPEGALGRVEPLCRYILREEGHNDGDVTGTDRAFLVLKRIVAERLSDGRDEYWRLVRTAAWHLWNHAEEGVRAAVLARLLPGLELVQLLVEQQEAQLAPDFETLAAVALHNVHLQPGGRDGSLDGEAEKKYLTEQAEQFFADLWTVPEE